jgi:hypothetical protein
MSALSESLARSPEAYPHSWDIAAYEVALVRLSEADYAGASFLDQRALKPGAQGQRIGLELLRAAVEEASLEERLGFIFHIGHVGSTLLSRLIGASPGVLALREPLPLRLLAQLKADLTTPESYVSPKDYERDLSLFLKLWSRRFRPQQLAIVKATSFASECAADLVLRPSQPEAILMYAEPEAYLAGILSGPNSRIEAVSMAQSRLRRLHHRLGEASWRLYALGEGERIAMSWACEMTALMAAADASPERTAWLDFDRFLIEPAPALATAFSRFGVEAAPAEIEALVGGPLMRQYSKAPEHAYDAALRGQVLDAGRAESAAEVRRGMAWLEGAARAHGSIAAALEVSAR